MFAGVLHLIAAFPHPTPFPCCFLLQSLQHFYKRTYFGIFKFQKASYVVCPARRGYEKIAGKVPFSVEGPFKALGEAKQGDKDKPEEVGKGSNHQYIYSAGKVGALRVFMEQHQQ